MKIFKDTNDHLIPNINLFFEWFCFLIYLVQTSLSQSLLNKGFMILDLNYNDTTLFAAQASQWSLYGSQNASHLLFTCNGSQILLGGGDPSLWEINNPDSREGIIYKEFDLPYSHDTIMLSIRIWFIDNWENYHYSELYFDFRDENNSGWNIFTNEFYSPYTNGSFIDICGEPPVYDLGFDIPDVPYFFTFPHTGNKLKVKIRHDNYHGYYGFQADPAQFGIRDLKILLSNLSIPYFSVCGITNPEGYLNYHDCSRGCSNNGYPEKMNIGCPNCHESCGYCYGTEASACLSCKEGYSYNGTHCIQCDSTCFSCIGPGYQDCVTCYEGDYIYPDGSCKKLCPSQGIFIEGYLYCDSPCLSSEFIFWNSTCQTSCEFPLGQLILPDGYQECTFPCSETEYLIYNGTCSNNCSFSLNSRFEGDRNFCDYPCNNDQYLYWNNSCLSSCPSPLLRIDTNKNFCEYPCEPNQYLNWNLQCEDSCFSPKQNRNDSLGFLYCDSPCLVASDYYMYELNTCLASCDFPLQQVSNDTLIGCVRPCPDIDKIYFDWESKTCKSTCVSPYVPVNFTGYINCSYQLSEEDVQQIQSVASLANGATAATGATVVASGLASPGDPGSISAAMLAKMLQYAKFINISYPMRLQLMFDSFNSTSGLAAYTPDIPESFKDDFPDEYIPPKFAHYHLHSSFLINFWNTLMALIIFFGVWVCFLLIDHFIFMLKFKFHSSFRSIRMAIQNLCITQFYSNFGDIVLFFILDVKSSSMNSLVTVLSLFTSIFFVGLVLISIYGHIKLLYRYQGNKKKSSNANNHQDSIEIQKFQKDYGGFHALFYNFKDTSFVYQGFFLFLALQTIFINLTIVLLNRPLAQVIIMCLCTMAMVTYLILARPFKILVNLLQQLVCQLILLIVNICLIIMAVEDSKFSGPSNLKESLGNIIILCSTVVNFVPPVFLVLKILDVAFRYYKTYQQTKKLKNTKTSIALSESSHANLNSSIQTPHQIETCQNHKIRYSQSQQVQDRASQFQNKINAPNPLRYKNQRAVPNVRRRLPKNISVNDLEYLPANNTNSPIFYRNTVIDSPPYNINVDNSSLNTSINSMLNQESIMKLSFNDQQSIIKLRSVENSNDISITNLNDGSFQGNGLGSEQRIKRRKNKNNHLRNQNSPTYKIQARSMKFTKK